MSNSESSYLQTSYSQDQRIEQHLKRLHKGKEIQESERQRNRQELFNEIFRSKSHLIFQLRGLYILYCNNIKIKFYFKPSDVVEYVRSNLKFYCKLVYCKKYQWWRIKRDSFPANYKKRIYALFGHFFVKDEEVLDIITRIYRLLSTWSKKEQVYRMEKFQRYLNGDLEMFEMDSDDLEFFFDEQQKQELNDKRNAILKRMIPPKRPMRQRRRIIQNIESDNSEVLSDTSN